MSSSKSINISFRINPKTMANICKYFAQKGFIGSSLSMAAREGLEGFGEIIEREYGGVSSVTEAFETLKSLGYFMNKKPSGSLVKDLGLESSSESSFKGDSKVSGLDEILRVLKDVQNK